MWCHHRCCQRSCSVPNSSCWSVQLGLVNPDVRCGKGSHHRDAPGGMQPAAGVPSRKPVNGCIPRRPRTNPACTSRGFPAWLLVGGDNLFQKQPIPTSKTCPRSVIKSDATTEVSWPSQYLISKWKFKTFPKHIGLSIIWWESGWQHNS